MTGTISWVPRLNVTSTITAAPTITANSAYVSGYRLGSIMSFPYAVREDTNLLTGVSQLVEVTILDKDKQDAAIDLWLFNASPTIASADHAAFSMTAANLVATSLGYVSVGSAYSDAATVSCSTTSNLGKIIQIPSTLTTGATTLYAVAVVRGTPTYTTTTSLQFQLSFYID